MTLRKLLIQRAARLQERPALTAPGWGTLDYGQWRNRVEGVALGLLAEALPVEAPVFASTGGPWDWAAEVAAACCGLRWDPAAAPIPAAILGGPRFNDELGRQGYHDREDLVEEGTLFCNGLHHAELLLRLQRLNRRLGWDHDTVLRLPAERLGQSELGAELRAALWSALYAGSHARLEPSAEARGGGFLSRWRRGSASDAPWDPEPFRGFWEP